MENFPQYDDNGSERMSWENIWRSIDPQVISGVDCFNPEALVNNDENLITLRLTGEEFLRMLSSLYNGAIFTYPEEFMQIVVNFLKGIHCPPLLSEQECYEYPTFAPFYQYLPMNPFTTPDEIPEGYLTAPFVINGQLPIPAPNYEYFDVIVPFDSLTLDVNWFEDISGQLPTIQISVNGAGQAYIKLLTIVQGGLAVITVDNPPNLADIIVGIVTGAENIVDLNMDVLSLPPETAQEIIFPVEIETEGQHTIYVVFLPILDDSFIPVRFGGGFRGVQLCGFVGEPDMAFVTAVRWHEADEMLQYQILGEWEDVAGWEDFAALVAAAQADADTAIANAAAAQSTANTAIANAAAAQSTANGAVSVNATQTANIANHETRIDSLEADVSDINLSISGLNTADSLLDGRLDSVENRLITLDFGGAWAWLDNFTTGANDYQLAGSAGAGWTSGQGWISDSNGLAIEFVGEDIEQNQVQVLQCVVVYTGAPTGTPQWRVNGGGWAPIDYAGIGNESYGWYIAPNTMEKNMLFEFAGTGNFKLTFMRYLGRGTVIPFD